MGMENSSSGFKEADDVAGRLLCAHYLTTRIISYPATIETTASHKGTSKNSYFAVILRCSQKMFPYISIICRVNIFYSRLVLLRTLNF